MGVLKICDCIQTQPFEAAIFTSLLPLDNHVPPNTNTTKSSERHTLFFKKVLVRCLLYSLPSPTKLGDPTGGPHHKYGLVLFHSLALAPHVCSANKLLHHALVLVTQERLELPNNLSRKEGFPSSF
jgi:hypothetical protein